MKINKTEWLTIFGDKFAEAAPAIQEKTKIVLGDIFMKEEDKKSAKKKCAGKKCNDPACDPPVTSELKFKPTVPKADHMHPYDDKSLRVKCLELALVTSRFEDDALKWARRYWHWVQTGN